MSSKFNTAPGVQKKPAVCKKPPIPPQFPPPPFADQMFQFFCSWNAPAYSFALDIKGTGLLIPDPPALQHTGDVNGDVMHLDIIQTEDPHFPALNYRINVYYGGGIIDFVTLTKAMPAQLDPFDSGLLQFQVPSPKDQILLRVYA